MIYAQTLSTVLLEHNLYRANYAETASVFCGLYISLARDSNSIYEANQAKYGLSAGYCKFCASLEYSNISFLSNEVMVSNE